GIPLAVANANTVVQRSGAKGLFQKEPQKSNFCWTFSYHCHFGKKRFRISALLLGDLVTHKRTDFSNSIHVPQLRRIAAGNSNRTMRSNKCLPLVVRNKTDELSQPIRLQTTLDLIDERDAGLLICGRGDFEGDHPSCSRPPIGKWQAELVFLRQ